MCFAASQLIKMAKRDSGCNLEDLALRLDVPYVQLANRANWQNNDVVPEDALRKINDLIEEARMLREQPKFLQWAGSYRAARYWDRLIKSLARAAVDDNFAAPLHPAYSDMHLLDTFIIETLTKMVAVPPKVFPIELRCYFERLDQTPHGEEHQEFLNGFTLAIVANPYARTIGNIFFVLNSLWPFYATHVRDAADDQAHSAFDAQMCIEASMFDLAATMIEIDEAFAPNISGFRRNVRANYKKWFAAIKNSTSSIGKAFQIAWMTDAVGIENDPAAAATRSFEHYLETASA
jgi:hypothetical protein